LEDGQIKAFFGVPRYPIQVEYDFWKKITSFNRRVPRYFNILA